ncbi:hypothetical protein [Marinobacter halophilus]|uniref:Phosphodiesterase n=1 Tax=Marinobacter halophilus TaxID=1323740 RepID=A0A2T1K949_9GAMM|nr:hypothetical protein [Marinobacter halophilus]PSF06570.1 hypothetical protein C7H08_15865 [Marinobacter halophilus]GGC73716.1 hypothetical protein GCM10011362_22850 [Marinobacter halophilus]
MKNKRTLLAAIALTSLISAGVISHAQAEQLTVPVGTQADRSQISLPATGMTQESVRNRWGAPQDMKGPIGEPPISQWHYPDFIVYFEHNRVLHSVVRRNR